MNLLIVYQVFSLNTSAVFYVPHSCKKMEFNPFSTNIPLLCPLITSKNRRFSDFYRGYRSGTMVENGLSNYCSLNQFFLNINADKVIVDNTVFLL